MAAATSKSNTTKKATRKRATKKTAPEKADAKAAKNSTPTQPGTWPDGPHPTLYSPEWKEYFRKIILDRREELLRELGYLKESSLSQTTDSYSGDSSTYSFHMADQGTDAQEREKAFHFASRDSKLLRLLDAALLRIENGTYGYCQQSNEPIEFKRLEAIPHAKYSVATKKKMEEAKNAE